MAKLCAPLLAALLLLAVSHLALAEDAAEGSCANSDAGVEQERVQPKYKPSQAALTAFFKLHEPVDAAWTAEFVALEITDGCPLNGMYRRFKNWISEGATAFPNLVVKITPGMDPILQFQATKEVGEGDLGVARVDVSDMEIDEVEHILQRRGLRKDEALAGEAAGRTAKRLEEEGARRAAHEAAEKAALEGSAPVPPVV